jgi:hypothetical protein
MSPIAHFIVITSSKEGEHEQYLVEAESFDETPTVFVFRGPGNAVVASFPIATTVGVVDDRAWPNQK